MERPGKTFCLDLILGIFIHDLFFCLHGICRKETSCFPTARDAECGEMSVLPTLFPSRSYWYQDTPEKCLRRSGWRSRAPRCCLKFIGGLTSRSTSAMALMLASLLHFHPSTFHHCIPPRSSTIFTIKNSIQSIHQSFPPDHPPYRHSYFHSSSFSYSHSHGPSPIHLSIFIHHSHPS